LKQIKILEQLLGDWHDRIIAAEILPFLNEVDPGLKTRKILKPYRRLAKSIGVIRDGHIAVHLIQELDEICPADKKTLVNAIKSKSRIDYRLFKKSIVANALTRVRVPTIRSMGLSERAILREKPIALKGLLSQIMSTSPRMTAEQWHKKRILLKRYHHKLDAFCFCPGHSSDESELKQIKILEQLLGDWHDRIIAAEILPFLNGRSESRDCGNAQTGQNVAGIGKGLPEQVY
jgi:CHAD domain-containing protein